MDFTAHTELVAVDTITPVHEVMDEAKLESLAASMAEDGWQGRPLLVVADGYGGHYALTGSHRYAGAVEAGLEEVPCIVIPEGAPIFVNLRGEVAVRFEGVVHGVRLTDDDERLQALREHGLEVAAELMAAEIEANEAEYESLAA